VAILVQTGNPLSWVVALVALGAAGGAGLGLLQGHPRRILGLVPLGVLTLLLGLACAWGGAGWIGPSLLLGAGGGLVNVALWVGYLEELPDSARGRGLALAHLCGAVCMAGGALLGVGLDQGAVPVAGQFGLLIGLAILGTGLAGWAFFREGLELLVEILMWPCYRIRAHGPGLAQLPRQGPVLVLANHSAWFDPLWVAKILPRRLVPMMTSKFYDLPILHWLMTRVVGAIRVKESRFRREAPELAEAIAVLDRGECLVVFPEGYMRRHAEQYVRKFGQGIWRILRERPRTPVVACWIEGGWGSYTSYYGGPPTVHKRLDWWRSIDIAVGAPQMLDPALLDDQRATRNYLMHACLDQRRWLGLEVKAAAGAEMPSTESDEEDEEPSGAATAEPQG
jgi:1-acyl-sn-glycerol-3-phosphate acyltransferase